MGSIKRPVGLQKFETYPMWGAKFQNRGLSRTVAPFSVVGNPGEALDCSVIPALPRRGYELFPLFDSLGANQAHAPMYLGCR
jgi:hypothetical protein